MNKTIYTIISSIAALSLFAAVPAFAQSGPQHGAGWGAGGGPRGLIQRIFDRPGAQRPQPLESFGGKITAVSSPDFTLEIPALGRLATTTVNVATDASTTFMLA